MSQNESLLNTDINNIPTIQNYSKKVFAYLLFDLIILTISCSINYNSFLNNNNMLIHFNILWNIIITILTGISFTIMYMSYHQRYTKTLTGSHIMFNILSSLLIAGIIQPLDNDTVFKSILSITTNACFLYIITRLYIRYDIEYCPSTIGYISYMATIVMLLLYELTIRISSTKSIIIIVLTDFVFIAYILYDIHITYNYKSNYHYSYYIYPITNIIIDFIMVPIDYIKKLKNYLNERRNPIV